MSAASSSQTTKIDDFFTGNKTWDKMIEDILKLEDPSERKRRYIKVYCTHIRPTSVLKHYEYWRMIFKMDPAAFPGFVSSDRLRKKERRE